MRFLILAFVLSLLTFRVDFNYEHYAHTFIQEDITAYRPYYMGSKSDKTMIEAATKIFLLESGYYSPKPVRKDNGVAQLLVQTYHLPWFGTNPREHNLYLIIITAHTDVTQYGFICIAKSIILKDFGNEKWRLYNEVLGKYIYKTIYYEEEI